MSSVIYCFLELRFLISRVNKFEIKLPVNLNLLSMSIEEELTDGNISHAYVNSTEGWS